MHRARDAAGTVSLQQEADHLPPEQPHHQGGVHLSGGHGCLGWQSTLCQWEPLSQHQEPKRHRAPCCSGSLTSSASTVKTMFTTDQGMISFLTSPQSLSLFSSLLSGGCCDDLDDGCCTLQCRAISGFRLAVENTKQLCMGAQANNAYIFPAIGFAAILTEATQISDEVFLVAARCLSEMTHKLVRMLFQIYLSPVRDSCHAVPARCSSKCIWKTRRS